MIKPILLTRVSALKKYTKGVPGDAVIVIVAAVYGATHYFYGTDLPDEVFASIVVAVVGVVRLFKRNPKEKKRRVKIDSLAKTLRESPELAKLAKASGITAEEADSILKALSRGDKEERRYYGVKKGRDGKTIPAQVLSVKDGVGTIEDFKEAEERRARAQQEAIRGR